MLFARTCSLAVFVILFVNLTDSLGLLFCAGLNVIILAKRKYRAWSNDLQYTAISRKVVGKSARDNPERSCGWF